MIVALTKPVMHGDKEVVELDLREPSAEDVMKCGYPMAFSDGEVTPNAEAVGALVSRLAGVPPSVVKQICIKDFQSCLAVVLGFFG